MSAFGDRLWRERRWRRMTQVEFGSLLGLTGKHVSNYENGRREPKRDRVAMIELKLGLPVGHLERLLGRLPDPVRAPEAYRAVRRARQRALTARTNAQLKAQGWRKGRRKLTPSQVLSLFPGGSRAHLTGREAGLELGVTKSCVNSIRDLRLASVRALLADMRETV